MCGYKNNHFDWYTPSHRFSNTNHCRSSILSLDFFISVRSERFRNSLFAALCLSRGFFATENVRTRMKCHDLFKKVFLYFFWHNSVSRHAQQAPPPWEHLSLWWWRQWIVRNRRHRRWRYKNICGCGCKFNVIHSFWVYILTCYSRNTTGDSSRFFRWYFCPEQSSSFPTFLNIIPHVMFLNIIPHVKWWVRVCWCRDSINKMNWTNSVTPVIGCPFSFVFIFSFHQVYPPCPFFWFTSLCWKCVESIRQAALTLFMRKSMCCTNFFPPLAQSVRTVCTSDDSAVNTTHQHKS